MDKTEDKEKVDKKRMKTISELKKSISDTESKKPAANVGNKSEPVEKPEAEPVETSDGTPAETPAEDEMLKKLEAAEARANDNMDKYVRTLAEFDNFRKRTAKEKAAIYGDGAADIIKSLLPVIDSFDRALASCGEEDKDSSIYKGMELIYKQLAQFMEENEIAKIESVGCEFNPEVHSAIAHVDDPQFGENEIIEEMQKGYMLKDKIIRHSMVKVAN